MGLIVVLSFLILFLLLVCIAQFHRLSTLVESQAGDNAFDRAILEQRRQLKMVEHHQSAL